MDVNAKPVASVELSLSRMRCLIVDDDPSFLEGVQTFLSSQGYDVDIARSPDKAVEMLTKNREREYQLVIVDINFADLTAQKGDEFVLNNQKLFGAAKKVIVSAGNWLTSSRLKVLQSAGIVFVEKSPRLPAVLQTITQQENQRLTDDLKRFVANELQPRIEELIPQRVSLKLVDTHASSLASDALISRLKKTLLKLLMSTPEFDEPILYYGQKVYTAKELAEEVKNETEIGLALIEMLLREFEHSLNVD